MSVYVDISLPLPLKDHFCYEVPVDLVQRMVEGGRAIVPFGLKTYTGIVLAIHSNKPLGYKTKQIYQVIDSAPIVNAQQIDFYRWLAKYYLVSLGEVFKTVLPTHFFLESRTTVQLQDSWHQDQMQTLSDEAFLIVEALEQKKNLRIEEVQKIIGQKNVFKALDNLIAQSIVTLTESHVERYKPKLEPFLQINSDYLSNKENVKTLLDNLKQSPRQKEVALSLFSIPIDLQKKPIHVGSFIKEHHLTRQHLKALEQKGVLSIFEQPVDRIQFDSESHSVVESNKHVMLRAVQKEFEKKKPILLYGSSLRENLNIYTGLIKTYLKGSTQVLLLLPEHFSTLQFIDYFKTICPVELLTYHTKMSQDERVETWHKVLNQNNQPQLIIGTKLALFLPFSNLKLVMVEDEHVNSYKQSFTGFKYHCRDSAVVLAQKHGANILLTSLTPSIESFYNASQGKYALVTFDKSVSKHDFEVINLKEAQRRKQTKGHFSNALIERIEHTLQQRKKVILFQNRRGYAPSVQCKRCGSVVYCPHCDVTLTYYKSKGQLRCHYCNYSCKNPDVCLACGSTDLHNKGFGTEQLEQEVKTLFPEFRVGRLDYDTTRKKNSFLEIITGFELGQVDILIGTQILNSGIDFKRVGLLGIVSLESLLSFPDFRVNEHAYQLIQQLSMRTVAKQDKSKLVIQTYNPEHDLIKFLMNQDYEMFYSKEIDQRQQFSYPPYVHLTKVTFKHRQEHLLDTCAQWFVKSLYTIKSIEVLGPSLPPVSKVKNEYFRDILIKHNPKTTYESKDKLAKLIQATSAISQFRSIKLSVDVDCY